MANNVNITPGTGDVVAAEEVSSAKYQKVKLVDSTAGSTAGTGVIGNPLYVIVTNSTITITGSTSVVNTVAITGSTSVVNTVAITGSTSVVNTVSAVVPTGSTIVLGTVIVSNSTIIITGSTSVVNTVAVTIPTGSTGVIGTVAISNGTLPVTNAGTFAVQIPTGSTGVIGTVAISNGTLPVTVPTGATIMLGTVVISNGTNVTITGSTSVVNTVNTVVPTGVTIRIGTVVVSNGTNVSTIVPTGATIMLGTVVVSNGTNIVITGSTSVVNVVSITGSTVVVSRTLQPGRFKGQVDNADTTTARTVVAAVSNSTSYITAYMISALVAGSYWLEDSAGTAMTPKHYFAANGGVSFVAVEGMPIGSAITNTTINVKGSVAGSVGCLVLGYAA